MPTSLMTIYNSFFNKIEKDIDFFTYNNVSDEEAMQLAVTRAREYLGEAIVRFTTSCSVEVDLTIDDSGERIVSDLTLTEIDILASLMKEKYFEKDTALLKAFQVNFSPKDLQLFSPANERKTFMDMYNRIVRENDKLISRYAARDRITGKLKTINYSDFSSD